MPKKKTQKRDLVLELLSSYNKFFEKIFENQIFSTSDQKILQKIYQKLEEISALISGLED
jgi:hypothetical protein